MVFAGETLKFTPLNVLPILTPPEGTVYQFIELPADIAFKSELPPRHIAVGVAVTGLGAATIFTVTVTEEVPVQPFPSVPVTV